MTRAQIHGWGIVKNGRFLPQFDRTKASLLIGYDMIPLRGLRRTERVLISKGLVPTRCILREDPTSRGCCWVAVGPEGFVTKDADGRTVCTADWSGLFPTRESAIKSFSGLLIGHWYWMALKPGSYRETHGKRYAKRFADARLDAIKQLTERGVRFIRARMEAAHNGTDALTHTKES